MIYIGDRDDFYEEGVSPRQRRVFVLRWNPSIFSFTRNDFEEYFGRLKGVIPSNSKPDDLWTIWDWKEVMHRDLFVMMLVGQEVNGIVWGGFLGGMPFQFEDEKGNLSRSRYIEMTTMYMHRIENTGMLTAEKLIEAIPEVDWLHGHSGELISIESAEKLGLLLVKELKDVKESDDIFFDSFCDKKYVLNDILTFMCPELKSRLIAMGRNTCKTTDNVDELMIQIQDEDYSNWDKIEEHLVLDELNGIML